MVHYSFQHAVLLFVTFCLRNVSSCPYQRKSRNLQGFDVDIQALFANRHLIQRSVETTVVGVDTITTSLDDGVVLFIQDHVQDMMHLDGPIRRGDPLFVSLFENIDQTHMNVTFITHGVMVTHTATTDCGVLLVQEHANQITRFLDTGIRRPNFEWKEPIVCRNPTLIHPGDVSTAANNGIETRAENNGRPEEEGDTRGPVQPEDASHPEESSDGLQPSGTVALEEASQTEQPVSSVSGGHLAAAEFFSSLLHHVIHVLSLSMAV